MANTKRTAAAAISGAASRSVHHPGFVSQIWESGSFFIFHSLQERSSQSKMKPEDNSAQLDRRQARIGSKFAAVTLEFAALHFSSQEIYFYAYLQPEKGSN